MKMLLASAAAVLLAACGGNDAGNDAQNVDMTIDNGMSTTGDNVATDNLTLDSNASNVDQAINQTDMQSGVPEAANSAVNSADNAM